MSSYRRHGCRCDECRRVNREYMRFYRQSKLTTPIATSQRAYRRAELRLIDLHLDEFLRLVEDETAREATA